MTINLTGTSALGRQVLGTTTTTDRYFSVHLTAYNDSAPLVKRYGQLILEQDLTGGLWRAVATAPIWTNGVLIDLTFNQIAPMRVVAQWKESGIAYRVITAGVPR